MVRINLKIKSMTDPKMIEIYHGFMLKYKLLSSNLKIKEYVC